MCNAVELDQRLRAYKQIDELVSKIISYQNDPVKVEEFATEIRTIISRWEQVVTIERMGEGAN